MKILVIPGNIRTPKSYPHWDRLLELLKDHEVRKLEGILPEADIIALINWCDIWISIDSFLQHLVAYHHLKPGIVLWGQSDPLIFGYPTNINLLKDRKYLRPLQFRFWSEAKDAPDAFVQPEIVIQAILDRLPKPV
jgi:ADP-heptose:LPS heptosyltransferase